MDRLQQLRQAGVSIWLDTLSRDLLDTGEFTRLVDQWSVSGATSNPTIFERALRQSDRYDDQLRRILASGQRDARAIFFDLALEDVGRAADILRPVHETSRGRDGFVSFECTPDLAYDTEATIDQALYLWARLDRPNVMIKVPATDEGLGAIEELTGHGVNVNVTLLFSVARYEAVIDAFVRGLERRLRADEAVAGITSVASFFVSRVDAKADPRLGESSPLRGRVAMANAQVAYQRYRARFSDPRWKPLAEAGAGTQRPLWASTATKDSAYSDVAYVEGLIAPDVINTMPLATMRAYADHGRVGPSIDAHVGQARRILDHARSAGLDLDAVTAELEREGVASFCDSYRQLIEGIQDRAGRLGIPLRGPARTCDVRPPSGPSPERRLDPDGPVGDRRRVGSPR